MILIGKERRQSRFSDENVEYKYRSPYKATALIPYQIYIEYSCASGIFLLKSCDELAKRALKMYQGFWTAEK